MDFEIKNLQESPNTIARRCGYTIIDNDGKGVYNLVRKLNFNNFPRFHIYLKLQSGGYIFSLHLDQKAPVYGGNSHAHNGEYFGPIIDEEADRIKQAVL